MASPIIIPIIVILILGLSGYLVYKFLIFDLMCKRNVRQTLQRYRIRKTPGQIIKEFYVKKGETLSEKEIRDMEKAYRQREPEQFLAMYDFIRDDGSDS